MFRKATEKDLDQITELYSDVHTEEEAGKTTIGWIRSIYPTRATVETAFAADDLFVEVIDENIVAAARINQEQVDVYADVDWEYKVPAEEVMVLHTLAVSPKEKRKGYGAAFVKFYEEYALENGCHYLRMDTNQTNRQARAMYKKLGYTEVGIVPCVFNGIEGLQLVCLEKKV